MQILKADVLLLRQILRRQAKGRKQKVAKPPVRFQNLHYKNQIFGSNGLVSSHYALFFDEELKIRQNVHQVDTLVNNKQVPDHLLKESEMEEIDLNIVKLSKETEPGGHLTEKITVLDLCRPVKIGVRTLNMCFQVLYREVKSNNLKESKESLIPVVQCHNVLLRSLLRLHQSGRRSLHQLHSQVQQCNVFFRIISLKNLLSVFWLKYPGVCLPYL